MSTSSNASISAVVVPTDAAFSRSVGSVEYRDAVALVIEAPSSLDGDVTTRSIQVSSNGTTWASLVDAGGAVTLPGAGQARHYFEMIPTFYWRIAYNAAPAVAETWTVTKQWTA